MSLRSCWRAVGAVPRLLWATKPPGRVAACSPVGANFAAVSLLRRLSSAPGVTYEQLKALLAAQTSTVIDVREPWELREYGIIPGSINVPCVKELGYYKHEAGAIAKIFKALLPVVVNTERTRKALCERRSQAHQAKVTNKFSPNHVFVLFDSPVGQVNTALQLGPEEFREKYGGEMPQQADKIVFTCLAGVRSKNALDTATSLGYKNVQHYPGGWQEWMKNEQLK